ncbi:MAG TPA: hypothetical protein VF610_06240 [Segetibacter sp.]|jgi:hypothetical protein
MLTKTLQVANENVSEQKKGFSSQVGENIGYEKGAKMVKNYHDQNNDQVSSHFIGRDMIEAILDQPGVVGITMLAGVDKFGAPQPVLVGVNADGDYVLNITSVDESGEISRKKGLVTAGVRYPGPNPAPKEEAWYA